MNVREWLVDTVSHMPPARALEALAAGDAERRVPGLNHSIAEILSHMDFWQEWFCGRCEGSGVPPAATADRGWPHVAPGTWPELQRRFLLGLERVVVIGEREGRLDTPVTPPIEFPPLAHCTIRDALVHIANHNAYHLGQIIQLRQMIGAWPPPSGSWTW